MGKQRARTTSAPEYEAVGRAACRSDFVTPVRAVRRPLAAILLSLEVANCTKLEGCVRVPGPTDSRGTVAGKT